jgi:hypothetical protein
MRRRERVRYEMFIRVIQFINDNIADFAVGSLVRAQLAVLVTVVAAIETLSGEQAFGLTEARFTTNSKGTARENLRDMLELISRTARSMVYIYPGIDIKFRLNRGESDANLLARARAYLLEALEYKNAFIDDFNLPDDFMPELQTLIDEFEDSLPKTGTAIDTHVEATAEIGEEIRKGMIAVRTMTGAVKNKYRDDVGKLAAWLSASHVRKEPESVPTSPVNP